MTASFKNKNILLVCTAILIVAAVAYIGLAGRTEKSATTSSPPVISAKKQNTPAVFDKTTYPTDTASSPWVVVNKGSTLPSDYVPANLTVPDIPLRYSASDPAMQVRSDTAAALEKLVSAAKQDGISLELTSGYRSYSYQVAVYNGYVKNSGVKDADTFSARPGHSEHQTGLAADLEPLSGQCELDQCFGGLPEGKWLAANAYKYGFIIRYPKNKENLTGYEYEPWHVRYVGTALAGQINKSGQTLEQFFGLPIYLDYPSQSTHLK